jgi:hypothetical protein
MDRLIKDRVCVEWIELGEGYCGDYDPTLPDDEELLRFDVYWLNDQGEWVFVEDSSYCTLVPACATPKERTRGLLMIMARVYDILTDSNGMASIKYAAAQASWISLNAVRINNLVQRS